MPKPRKFTAEQVAEALRAAGGLVTVTADRLGCTPLTVRHYMQKCPTVRQAWEDASDRILDFGESKLIERVREGEGWAICFLLKTKGRKRGYVERQEVTGADGGPIEVIDPRHALLSKLPALPAEATVGAVYPEPESSRGRGGAV